MNNAIAMGLMFAALADLFVAFFVVGPRVPPQSRMIMTLVMAGSSAVMMGVAIGLWTGLVSFE